ncbi:TetR/AcrR family transcriptional regulator [Mycobacterium sp. HM-7]
MAKTPTPRRRAANKPDDESVKAPPSLREMQKALTRGRVIEAALEEFDERDFASTTMDDIAVRANLSRGTIYLHFDSKAEILVAALESLEPDELSLFQELGAAQTRADIEAMYDHALTVWNQVGRIWRHARDAAATEPTLKKWSDGMFARQVRNLRNALQERGVPAAAAEVRATLLVGMWSEFMPRWALSPGSRGRKLTSVALTDFTIASFSEGLAIRRD